MLKLDQNLLPIGQVMETIIQIYHPFNIIELIRNAYKNSFIFRKVML